LLKNLLLEVLAFIQGSFILIRDPIVAGKLSLNLKLNNKKLVYLREMSDHIV